MVVCADTKTRQLMAHKEGGKCDKSCDTRRVLFFRGKVQQRSALAVMFLASFFSSSVCSIFLQKKSKWRKRLEEMGAYATLREACNFLHHFLHHFPPDDFLHRLEQNIGGKLIVPPDVRENCNLLQIAVTPSRSPADVTKKDNLKNPCRGRVTVALASLPG